MPEHYAKPDGLEHLYTECFDMLYKLACRQLYQRTGSAADAADIVQSVFLIAAQKWETLQKHPQPVGWLVKAVCYTCANYSAASRRDRQKTQRSKDALLKRQPQKHGKLYTGAAEDDTAEVDILVSLEQLLSKEDYALLKGFCLENRSVAEISRETGRSEAAVRMRIHRLRKMLSRFLILLVTFVTCRNI